MDIRNNFIHKKYLFEKQIQYFLMRNIVPYLFFDEKTFANSSKLFANSFPKSGTHLLRHVLSMMPGVDDRWTYHFAERIIDYKKQLHFCQKGQIVSAHMKWGNEIQNFLQNNDFKIFFMIRDLRDIAVSNAHYLAKDKRHRLYDYFSRINSPEGRLMASIAGVPGDKLADGVKSESIGTHAKQYLPWLKNENCLLVRFEDLVGKKGGGSSQRQIDAITAIARHLKINLKESQLFSIAEKTFDPNTKTFRKGQIGGWQEAFTDGHKRLFKETAGDELIAFGYVEDNSW